MSGAADTGGVNKVSPYLPTDVPEAVAPARHDKARRAWDQELRQPLGLEGAAHGVPENWFLGPKAENLDIMSAMIMEALNSHAAFRRSFHPEDPSHITDAIRQSQGFQDGIVHLRAQLAQLLDKLKMSASFTSMRYQGHMLWDQAMPAAIGLFAGMLYNQNNVAAEASPVTTRLEIEVGNDLCRMLGYPVPKEDEAAKPGQPVPWGHITSGGTVANIEALWAARNLKFSAIALRQAIREIPALDAARALEVPLWQGGTARLVDLDTWTLLNLDVDIVAGLPGAIAALGVPPARLTRILGGYSVQNVGLAGFYRSYMGDVRELPVLLAPATSHYSWPKAATLLGLGQNAVLIQRVNRDARLDLEDVESTLFDLLRRRVPVLCAVAVIGSTEESAVDPLAGLLALRQRFRGYGLNFVIHADAAWGGYFRSMLREAGEQTDAAGVPTLAMSDYVRAQYEVLGHADSITVDPHKSGYAPYPAGALCYRNAAMRDAVSLQAPVVFHSQAEPTVGIYGVEGSKPGSAAASVWLAHRVIRPDRSGYGQILGQCMWTSKRLFCRLHALDDPRFRITMFNQTPWERARRPDVELAEERRAIRSFTALDNAELEARLVADPAAKALFTALGSDQVILAFSLNFRIAGGGMNDDLARANAFNERVFSHCSLIEPRADTSDLELILTSSRYEPRVYGHHFVDAFCRRLGVRPDAELGVDFLISTTMDPWTTETERGDFLVTLQEALRRAAHRSLDELGSDSARAVKIATFNVNNVNKRLPNLLRWLDTARPDVVCLQELKAENAAFPAAAVQAAGYGAVWAGQRSWNGVAILARGAEPVLTRRALPGDPADAQARYIEAAVRGVLVGSLYLPNGNPQPGPKFAYKLAWFERLIAHAASLVEAGLPVVLAGDYNVVPTPRDMYASRSHDDNALVQPESRAAYARLLAQGWTDALRASHPEEPMYTFWAYLRNGWPRDAGWRLDHLLLSPAIAGQLAAAGVDRAVRGEAEASDHAPAWVTLRGV